MIPPFSRHIALTISCMLLYLLSFPSSAQYFIFTSDEPPMNYEEEGKITGLITELVNEIVKRSQTKEQSELHIGPWTRVLNAGLKYPNVVIYTVIRIPEREDKFHWIGPVLRKKWLLVGRKGKSLKFDDLEDYKKLEAIGVIRADARETLLEQQGFNNLYQVNTLVQAYKMLHQERLDLVATADLELPVLARKAGIPLEDLEAFYVLEEVESYIAISKSSDPKLIALWQQTYQKILIDGTLQDIAKKWALKLDIPLKVSQGAFRITKQSSLN